MSVCKPAPVGAPQSGDLTSKGDASLRLIDRCSGFSASTARQWRDSWVYETCPPHWEFLGKRVVPDWLYHQRCSGVLRSTHKYVVVGIKRVIDANGVIKLLLVFRRQPAKACDLKTIANRVIVRLRHGAQHL